MTSKAKRAVRRHLYHEGPAAPPHPVFGCEWFDTTPGYECIKWWNGQCWERRP